MGAGGDGTVRIGHTHMEICAGLFHQEVGEVLPAQGTGFLHRCVPHGICRICDHICVFRRIDGGRVSQGSGHVAGHSVGLADAVADGINVAEDLLDQVIVLGTDVAAQGNGICDDIGVLAAVYVGDGEYSGICGGLLFCQDLV